MSKKIKVGNAEIEKADYDYFSLLYSKMPKEYVIADLVSKCEDYNKLYKSYEKTQIELQQKENIIKEVRECIEKYEAIIGYYDSNYDGEYDTYSYDLVKEDVLKILDKAGDEK